MRILMLSCMIALAGAGAARAWGSEGHEVVAEIARHYLTPSAKRRVETLLGEDGSNTLTAHDMLSEANWADAYRGSGHKETASWHFVDVELDAPDLNGACYGFPPAGPLASQGPAQDCIVNKIDEFTKELADRSTPEAEQVVALKYILHFVGDLTQPLHASDNHDKGGNCVLLALGGPRTVNLHSYWDTTVVQELDADPKTLAERLVHDITPQQKAAWERGDAKAWALDSFEVSRAKVYTLGSKPGCASDQVPLPVPGDYDASSQAVAAVQLEKAGVRLAAVLNRTLGR